MDQLAECRQSSDSESAEAFFGKMANILDQGAVAVMASLGHRLGLFDALSKLPPAKSSRIAHAAGLNERYVREWLAVMVTGSVVTYDPATAHYALPPEHAACLTRDAELGNLAVYAQSVALAGAMQERVLACFQSGEGIPYGEYPCFHQVMAEDSDQTVVAGLDMLLDTLVPDVVARLEHGVDVLDAGCGAGHAAVRMALRFPNSRFVGLDLCEEAVQMAKHEANLNGLVNLRFGVHDLSEFDAPSSFDFITSFDAVHDMKDPQSLLTMINRTLRPDGVHLMQDVGGSAKLENNLEFPFASLLYTMSCMHCTPVSLAQGGEGLGTMWGWETAEAMINGAGFSAVERYVLPHDPMNVWFVNRKDGDVA